MTIPASCAEGIPAFATRSVKTIQLGPLRIEVRSNEPAFGGFRFFSDPSTESDSRAGAVGPPDCTVVLCDLNIDGPWPIGRLGAVRDRSYRGGRMATGYYLTDHFGAPAYLITRGTTYWIFAEDFTGILWPYVVKYLLTVYSMQHSMLHIKSAAVAINGRGALLVGRGGSGKTILLSQLCRSGAAFLSNTHTLISVDRILGVPTAMRVRNDQFFAPIIADRQLAPSVKSGEFIADPLVDLGWRGVRSANIGAICLLDYKGPQSREIRPIDNTVTFDYMDQFALALNAYGLKEDVLDLLNSDVQQFSVAIARMRNELRTLVDNSRCYYISCDAAVDSNVRSIYELLAHS